jgi:uncharacterized protein
MTIKNAVSWFEIPVNDYERAINFYEIMLDTKLQREVMNDIDFAIFPADEKAVAGALIKCEFLKPNDQGSLVYLNVDGFMDEAISRAQKNGAKVLFPKTNIGECGYIAHLSDSEGNKVALHSM